jgi:LPXTG-motif cell wall-anchored protein
MKRMKKIFAVILSLAMVMGMSLTALANPDETTEKTGEVTIKGVVAGATLNAYQVVSYDEKGEYVVKQIRKENVATDVFADIEHPATIEIQELPAYVNQLGNPVTNFTYDENSKSYKKGLAAGMWLILVSGSNEVIYEPMIVSVNVDTDGNLVGGGVDANGQFTPGQLTAKSNTKPKVEKTVENKTFEKDEKITFNVTAQIPQYDARYQDVEYVISDTLSNNLQFVQNSVKIAIFDTDEEAIDDNNYENTSGLTANFNGGTMTIDASSIALTNKGKYIKVKYQAELTQDAKNGLTNSATETNNGLKVEYSNNPSDKTNHTEQTDETKQYTFGINADIIGTESMSGTTSEFVKVAEGEYETIEKPDGTTEKVQKKLSDAEFQLLDGASEGATVLATNSTDVNGLVKFTGLKANKVYYLKESKAPSGYKIIDTYVPVIVKAHFSTDGKTLESYEIKIGGKVSGSGEDLDLVNGAITGSYTWDAGEKNGKIPDGTIEGSYPFSNTKLSSLPSTGGIGTTIFTIGGCAIMIIAAALFFASRRKEVK